jgi:hypothetical protein
MNNILVKPKYRDVVIGFNNSSLPLGYRTDLHIIYSLAKEKNNEAILEMFEPVPDETLEKIKVAAFVKKQQIKNQQRST